MKELEKLNIQYMGFAQPGTQSEVELEILGLELAIKAAEHRIATLKQGLHLAVVNQRDEEPKDENS